MSATSYAVMTKARAKFGKRLTKKDYNSLLECQSVSDVMSYLKSNTHYSKVLSDINDRIIHRGRLEALLKQNSFYEMASLCRYDTSLGSGFSQYIIQSIEVEQIMRFLVLLNSNSTDKFIYQFPSYFSKHTEIDINLLANIKSYDDFLKVISHSPFFDILNEYAPDEKGRLEISVIENRLNEYVLSTFLASIKKNSSKKEANQLTSFFYTINDYDIFSRILRLKKFYNLPAEEIKKNLLTEFCDINPKVIDMMCNADSSAEVFSIMQSTRNGKLIDKIGYVYASDISPRVKYRLAKNNIHFSNSPSMAMISYMYISEIELMNIISLIEGIRYNLDRKVIENLLIY